MTTRMRRKVLAASSAVGLVIGGASLAWACTRNPSISLSPSFGRAGSQTQVTGSSFLPGEPVEIRWNSATGPVLGRAAPKPDYSFSVPVVVPADAPNGTYYIVAIAPASRAQAAFQVRNAVSATNNEPASQPDAQTSASGDGGDSTETSAGQTSASTRGGNGAGAGAGEQSGDLGFAEPQAAADASAPAPAGDRQASSSPARAEQSRNVGRVDALTGGVVSPATPASGPSAASPAPAPNATPAPASDESPAPAPRSATADLWSGFAAGSAASLTPGLESPAPATDGTTPLAVGVGLLSAGLVALGLGFGAAEVRRKRAHAGREA